MSDEKELKYFKDKRELSDVEKSILDELKQTVKRLKCSSTNFEKENYEASIYRIVDILVSHFLLREGCFETRIESLESLLNRALERKRK